MSKEEHDKRRVTTEGGDTAHDTATSDLSSAVSQELRILELINSGQRELGETARYLRVPEVPEETRKALSGVRISIVDDTRDVLCHWQPVLLTATGGNAATIWHRSQSAETLLKEIISTSPDVILLDYELADDLTGADLVTSLKVALPHSVIIGFSSSSSNNQALQRAGAHTSADKGSRDEVAVLQAICSAYQQFSIREVAAEAAPTPELMPAVQNIQHTESALKRALLAGVNSGHVVDAMSRLACLVTLKNTAPEFRHEEYTIEKACVYGAVRLMNAFERMTRDATSDLERFLIVVSDRFLYNEEIRSTLGWFGPYYTKQFELQKQLVEFLPEEVRRVTDGEKLIASAANGGNFALLFDRAPSTRHLITGDQLIELSDVTGYKYLDMSPHGKPFIRCVTSRGGGRAFFDGERLMAHPMFTTCAPKVSFFDGGYIVNSRDCTIINGMLYPLINAGDRVASSIGANDQKFGFSDETAVHSFSQNDEIALQLTVDARGVVHINGESIHPIGVFLPSRRRQQDNGFMTFEWSEFRSLVE